MELYTIDPDNGFRRDTLIDAYESYVWAERFIEPGDINLVLPATAEFVRLTRPGTILGLSTSRELMILNTRTIEDTKITAIGKTLESFFDYRRNSTLYELDYPGKILGAIVTNMQTRRGGDEAIARLRVGDLDATPDTITDEKIPAGSVHANLLIIAKKYTIGMAVHWTERIDNLGYDLVFTTWAGSDRSIGENPIIFSPKLDNLANVKELLSDVGAANIAIAYPPENLELAEGMAPYEARMNIDYTGFERRVVEINMNFITKPDQLFGISDEQKQESLYYMMRDKARAALKSKKRVIDGEFVPDSQFVYYTEPNPENLPTYRLGDIVQVQGNFTDPTRSILAEYIHSSDGTGSRSYPGFVNESEFVPEPPIDE